MMRFGQYYACDECPELHTTAAGATACKHDLWVEPETDEQ
jgi:hypothetical protein